MYSYFEKLHAQNAKYDEESAADEHNVTDRAQRGE